MKVVTSGYASLDRIFQLSNAPKVGETSLILNDNNWMSSFGGCSPNIAYNLSKLGIDAYPVMRVGNDFDSSGYKKYLTNGGVCLDYVSEIKNDVTPFCFLFEDDACEHTTIFYSGAQHSKYYQPIKEEYFHNASYGVVTVGDPKENMEFIDACRQSNVPIAFGMRGDHNSFPSELLVKALNSSEVIFMNRIERDFIEKQLNLLSINDLYKTGRAQIIVVTLGKDGCQFSTKQEHEFVHVPAINTPVVDTTGSGDAFISGFIYGLLNKKDTLLCAQMGSLLSSFTIQAQGCTTNSPNLEQFLEALKETFC